MGIKFNVIMLSRGEEISLTTHFKVIVGTRGWLFIDY